MNTIYKDTFFRSLLKDDKRFLDVANATFDLHLTGEGLEDASLDSVFFTQLRSDCARIIDGQLIILLEHQSTVNKNMPFRMLCYISETYQKILDSDSRYKAARQEIPYPLFAVFYNGDATAPEKEILRLSDAFKHFKGSDERKPQLELEVPVFNINYSPNNQILKKSSSLCDYAALCHNVAECKKAGTKNFIHAGVLKSIEENILSDYLKTNMKEVVGMLNAEYDYDTDIRVKSQESWEEGVAWQKAQSEKEFNRLLLDQRMQSEKEFGRLLSEQKAQNALIAQLQAQIAALQASR